MAIEAARFIGIATHEEPEASKWEETLDWWIKEWFTPTKPISYEFPHAISPRMGAELWRRYQAAGWEVNLTVTESGWVTDIHFSLPV